MEPGYLFLWFPEFPQEEVNIAEEKQQIILAMILTEICIFKKSSTQVLAQISYPVFPLVQGYNNLPLYQPAAAVAYSPVQPMASSQLLTNHALNLRKQKLYRNFMLNRALRQKGLISREKYLRNMKQNEETYRQILKQMYQAERNAQQYDWDNIPIRSTPTTTTAPASSKIPKYQKFKIKFKNGKNKGFTLSQFVPNEIIPVMRSVPNPDSINNAIVNLAQTEPLREKIMNQQLRRPANSIESGEYLDTFRKHKHSGNTAQVQTDTIDVSSLRGDIGRKLQPFEDASKENFETQPFGFQGISLEEIKNRRVSQNRIRHDERKKYSTKISANQGDVQSTEVVEGELFPIQLQGAPVYKKPGESPQHRGQTGNTVPEIRANMFLADQNGIMHKIRDNMVSE
ncbi:hypothetical protein M8J75_008584 [Diaphorina citri]|nr:hypothetical protein M8J75_008584 [Diaphorina citri]KAI5739489.1 hypothetical protein M8J77_019881 [Diaphorina citri]